MDCTSFSIPKTPCRHKIDKGLEGGAIQAKAKYMQYYYVAMYGPFGKAVCRGGVLARIAGFPRASFH